MALASSADRDEMLAAARQTQKILKSARCSVLAGIQIFTHFCRKPGSMAPCALQRLCAAVESPDWSKWLLDEKRSGGALLDLLVHDIDQALDIFGAPAKVAAKSLGEIDTGERHSHLSGWPGSPYSGRLVSGWDALCHGLSGSG